PVNRARVKLPCVPFVTHRYRCFRVVEAHNNKPRHAQSLTKKQETPTTTRATTQRQQRHTCMDVTCAQRALDTTVRRWWALCPPPFSSRKIISDSHYCSLRLHLKHILQHCTASVRTTRAFLKK
ncbi:unnamed protein product, partial [Ectocarpus fasciculatus]